MKFQRAKGTLDYYPLDESIKSHVLNVFLDVAQRYGFLKVESPVMEELSLLSEKQGDETKEQIFVLEQRGEEKYGLRFDMTVPLARLFCESQKSLPKPIKWSYTTRNWRYERPQKGRLREFYQMGVELLGSFRPEADVEVISVAIDTLKGLGLSSDDFVVEINNRKLAQGLFAGFTEGDLDALLRIIDKKDKLSSEDFKKSLNDVGVADCQGLISLLESNFDDLKKMSLDGLAKEGFLELAPIMELLDPKMVRLSLSTVRGLSYYTGTVFEIYDKKKQFRAVTGGGRYDKMIEQFGGEATPATGMAMGFHTLLLLLESAGKVPKPDLGPDYLVAPVDDTVRVQAWELVARLRKHHKVEYDLDRRS